MYCEGSGSSILVASSDDGLGFDDAVNKMLGINDAEAVDCANSVVLSIGLELLVVEVAEVNVDLGIVAVTKAWIAEVTDVVVVDVEAEYVVPDELGEERRKAVVDGSTVVHCVELLVRSAYEP